MGTKRIPILVYNIKKYYKKGLQISEPCMNLWEINLQIFL